MALRLTAHGIVRPVENEMTRRTRTTLSGAEERTGEVDRVSSSTGSATDVNGGSSSKVKGTTDTRMREINSSEHNDKSRRRIQQRENLQYREETVVCPNLL